MVEGIEKGDIVKGFCDYQNKVVEGPVTRLSSTGCYIDLGDDSELWEAFISYEKFIEFEGEPVTYRVWTRIDVECNEFSATVEGYVDRLSGHETYDDAYDTSGGLKSLVD